MKCFHTSLDLILEKNNEILFLRFKFWFFSFGADSLEDDASLNISTLNRTRAASVSLNTSSAVLCRV